MAILDEIGASIRELGEGAGTSVVGIGQRWGAGSGIVLSEGKVLTNAHNVRGDRVTVTFADGRAVEGDVTGRDIDGDLAVIGVDTGAVPAPPWASGSRSTPTASARASTGPYPPTRRSGAGPIHWPAGNQHNRRGSALPSRRTTWPGGSAALSACPTPMGYSSATWPTTARLPALVSPRAT